PYSRAAPPGAQSMRGPGPRPANARPPFGSLCARACSRGCKHFPRPRREVAHRGTPTRRRAAARLHYSCTARLGWVAVRVADRTVSRTAAPRTRRWGSRAPLPAARRPRGEATAKKPDGSVADEAERDERADVAPDRSPRPHPLLAGC